MSQRLRCRSHGFGYEIALVAQLWVLGCGAAETHVAGLAVYDLDCSPDQILVTRRERGILVAKGCGREMRYECWTGGGANASCRLARSAHPRRYDPPSAATCTALRHGDLAGADKLYARDQRVPEEAPQSPEDNKVSPLPPTRRELAKAFERQEPSLTPCYLCSLRDGHPSVGRVVLKLVIAPTGQVTDVTVVRAAAHDREFEACLLARIRTWRFPKWRGDQPGTVMFPAVFSRVGKLDAERPYDDDD